MPHYTNESDDAFVNRITFDFIAQVANRLETSQTKQNELAEKLNLSEGAVSQVLNLGRMNLTLKTMVRYARALGMKVAVVAYDDHDPHNENGPIGSEIFGLAWEKIGKPRDVWQVNDAVCGTKQNLHAIPAWRYSWTNSTLSETSGTIGNFPHISMPLTEEKATFYARD